jgi:hypothetical protein
MVTRIVSLKKLSKTIKTLILRGNSTITNKGNNKITELQTILQRESQNS